MPQPYHCRHIFVDGHQCGSPALAQEIFCFYHHTTRRPPRHLRSRGGFAAYSFNMPEDRASLQHSINEVLTLIAGADIDFKRAALLLRGLEVASRNLSSLARRPDPVHTTPRVDDIVFDPELGPLALEPQPEAQPEAVETISQPVIQAQPASATQPAEAHTKTILSTEPAHPAPNLQPIPITPEDRLNNTLNAVDPPRRPRTNVGYLVPEEYNAIARHRRPTPATLKSVTAATPASPRTKRLKSQATLHHQPVSAQASIAAPPSRPSHRSASSARIGVKPSSPQPQGPSPYPPVPAPSAVAIQPSTRSPSSHSQPSKSRLNYPRMKTLTEKRKFSCYHGQDQLHDQPHTPAARPRPHRSIADR